MDGSKFDVVTICNALVDISYQASNADLAKFQLTKGHMHLVDSAKQKAIHEHFSGKNASVELGGSSLNVIRALAALQKKTAFIGMVSSDHYGYIIKKRMEDLKIGNRLIFSDEDSTGTCVILVTKDGERTGNTHLGASRLYNKDHVPFDDIRRTRVFHVSGYQWDTKSQKEAIMAALQAAKEANCKISFDVADPAVVMHHKGDFLNIISEFADIVFANEEETRLLFDRKPTEAASLIADIGAIAAIKLGSKGALIQKGKEIFTIPPVKATVVDTTAAGDIFAAGFLFGYLSEMSLDTCGQLAAYMASDVISRFGTTVSHEVIENVLQTYQGSGWPDGFLKRMRSEELR
ncbi:MAG: adenosine kinase [Deltaproteobacteria bacterium]|nr:adenosine kinase [Deltaproteobacteria bacterium]